MLDIKTILSVAILCLASTSTFSAQTQQIPAGSACNWAFDSKVMGSGTEIKFYKPVGACQNSGALLYVNSGVWQYW